MKKQQSLNKKSGQVLLIVIMLLATAITIALSVSFTSRTETQITKLEEESQKTLAAAEAGIEQLIQQSDNNPVNISELGPGTEFNSYKGQATVDTSRKTSFTTPLLQKDEQYTFYLAEYNPQADPPLTNNFFTGNITINKSEPSGDICDINPPNPNPNPNSFAVELTFANKDGTVIRKLIDPCSVAGGSGNFPTAYSSPADYPQSHLLFLRIIAPSSSFPGAKLVISTTTGTFYSQGKTFTSEAQSLSGTTKKVELFQSYPQIPADLFITSF